MVATRLRPLPTLGGVAALLLAAGAALSVGPAGMAPGGVLRALADAIPLVDVPSGLDQRQLTILWELRLPRVALGALVGATLAMAGASYQGVFRNPLADPYLLGVAAGAGLGATLAIVAGPVVPAAAVPLAAFAGGVAGVIATYLLGRTIGDRTPTTLILAGVAVASFFTAAQTYVQQRNTDVLREVYAWILGRLTTGGWREVVSLLPYVILSMAMIVAHRRLLDVLAVGDAEAEALGVPIRRVRLVVVAAATLGTAAAVAVSGLIGFVGIIVPHTVRLLFGSSYRVVLPLSVLFGAAFLVATDLAARTVLSPAELPIGVVTAFFGAPFFIVVLRSSRRTL
jgi:iron complex transport system permease protein